MKKSSEINNKLFWQKKYQRWRKNRMPKPFSFNHNLIIERKNKNVIYTKYNTSGTYSNIFLKCFDENGKRFVIKTISNEEKLYESNLELFSEGYLHNKIYNICSKRKTNRILKILWMDLIRLGENICVCLALEYFDLILHKGFSFNDRDWINNIDMWYNQIKDELVYLNTEVGFFHRDIHTANIGIKLNGDWFLFDFGMSILKQNNKIIEAYQSDAFYKDFSFLPIHDLRIFIFSWVHSNKYSPNKLVKDWLDYELTKMDETPHSKWTYNTPIIFNKYKFPIEKCYFHSMEGDQAIIELKVNKRYISSLDGKEIYFTDCSKKFEIEYVYKKSVGILETTETKNIQIDKNNPHCVYYFYFLE